MNKYVVFLRGVNVGGRIIKMADLEVCLEAAGLRNVTTLLQSGNVVFESGRSVPELKKLIEAALATTFGYPAKAQVLTRDNLAAVVGAYPFGTAAENQHDYVVFLENGLEKGLATEPFELGAGEKISAGRGVLYWRVDKGSTLKTNFAKLLTKTKYKDFNTNRNLKTLRKLLAL